MRFALVFLLTICCLALRLNGQNYYIPEPKVFNGGVILGANFTQVDGDTYYGYHKIGLNAGGVVYVHFTKLFGASMELIYTQKGSRGETVTESPYLGKYVSKYFMDLNYVEIPLTFHLQWQRLDLEAGAAWARLINSHEDVLTDPPVAISPVINKFNNTDIDYVFGAGTRVYKQLYANLRFQYSVRSIRPLASIPAGYAYGSEGQFNNLLSLRVIYLF